MGKTLIINYLVTQVPWLAGLIPGFFLGIGVGFVTKFLATQGEFQAYVLGVHIRVYGQETNFVKAVTANMESPTDESVKNLIAAAGPFLSLKS